MNILVTGGAGFIGSHIVDAYLEQNHQVTVLDNLSTGDKSFIHPKARFYHKDLSAPDIGEILKKEKIEVINHHAAQVSVPDSVADPVFDAKSNIIGTLQLLQNAVSSGVKKFIFASTGGAIYGEQAPMPTAEEYPCKPESPYGISKFGVENYLRFYENNNGLKTVVFRYSNVFGPRQNPHGEAGVVAIFCKRLLDNRAPVIYGDGEQTRDYILVKDVVRANVAALEPECSGVFNIGTGKETSVNTLSEELLRLSGKSLKAEYAPARGYEQRRSCIAYRKFYDQFGWEPEVPLEEALIETFNYFKNQAP
ncbi:MAG: NAD-dependent epimerase/dehydratase family protein [Nitrospinaceae bacterium]